MLGGFQLVVCILVDSMWHASALRSLQCPNFWVSSPPYVFRSWQKDSMLIPQNIGDASS